jgi:hypothetical protein
MKNIVNTTVNTVVYVENGTYSYTMNGNDNNGNGGYSNRTFTISGYISGSFVDADDIDTYPVILFNTTNGNSGIYFYVNVKGCFEYLKINRGSNCNGGKRLIKIFIYYFLMVYLLIDKIFNL